MTAASAYRLGLPAWAFPGWKGRYFDAVPSALASYARVFATVEGNTTFYRIPDRSAVAAWQQALEGVDFELCFKLPKTVTHQRRPRLEDLREFLAVIEPLAGHLGPLLVQFPAAVGPDSMGAFEPVLAAVAERHRGVVEVRHPEFFERPALLSTLLDRYGLGRAVLDSRALYAGDADHPDVVAARHEKPDLPVQPQARNGIAFVRLVLHPQAAGNGRYLDQWGRLTAQYLAAGQRVYVMIHCPNNQHCPELAADFHARLRRQHRPDLAPLPPWPVPEQGSLL
jgi:uncharacterized protein YecE (DUF72 family)